MFFIMVICADFGRLFFSYIQLTNAAREGASYGSANPTDINGITGYAVQEANAQTQQGENPLVVTTRCATASGAALACASAAGGSGIGNTLTVTAHEEFDFLTPLISGFFADDFGMTASSTTVVFGLAAGGGALPPSGCAPPTIADFTVTVIGMTVNVDASASRPDTGVCAISGYNWDWAQTPVVFPPIVGKTATNTYASPGVYVIVLEVTNQAGALTRSRSVSVGIATPAPTATPVPTPAPSGAPTASPTATPTPAPTATPAPTPTPVPTATPTPALTCNYQPDFAYSIQNGHKVTFTGSYTGFPAPTSWLWNFGNGDTWTGQNPPQVNYNSGTYTVRLTIQGPLCTSRFITKVVNP
jgi:PKD repeat protein